MATVLESFTAWKEFLSDRVTEAKGQGMTEEVINKLAFQIGEYLDKKVDPKNEEERVLKALWDVGNENERKAIASMMVKLVSDGQIS
jgi:hypothetical protein